MVKAIRKRHIERRTSDSQSCSYTYDDLGRSASVGCGSQGNQTFTYDPFGNISKAHNGMGNSFQPTSYNAANQPVGVGMTFDSNGNTTKDKQNVQYTWDPNWGNMTSVNGITATYDALGRVVEQYNGSSYTQILYSPIGKVALMSGLSLVKGFVPLPGGGTAVYTTPLDLAYYRHADWLGSSRLASTQARTLYSSTAYAPFGEQYAASGSADLSFTGQNSDTSSSLYDFTFRENSPSMGRWLSPDPAGTAAADPTNPQSWNRYAYVQNQPMSYVDPTGLVNPVPPPSCGSEDGTCPPDPRPNPCETGLQLPGCGDPGCDYGNINECDPPPQPSPQPPCVNGTNCTPAPSNGTNPPACQATLLNMANQQLGTNFNSSNVSGSYMNGTAYNIIIQSNQLTAGQFNNIQQGRYTTSGWQYLTGAGLAGHIADETNLGFAQSAFQSSNIGGNLSVSFAFHDDHGYANNPIGALIHWITDVLGHNTRKPC